MRVSPSSFKLNQRRAPTKAEQVFWSAVRGRKLGGYKFARQVNIGVFTADFVCRQLKLIVELDGPEHAGSKRDTKRTQWLNEQGYGVLRFANEDVLVRRPQAFKRLLDVLEGRVVDATGELNFSPALPPARVRS